MERNTHSINEEVHSAGKVFIKDLLCGIMFLHFILLRQHRKRRQKALLSSVLNFHVQSFADAPKALIFCSLKGFLIYFAYGIRHSLEGSGRDEEDDEDAYLDNINTAAEEKSAIQANDHHQRNLSLPFIFHEKTSEC